jgi:hypothetical protein
VRISLNQDALLQEPGKQQPSAPWRRGNRSQRRRTPTVDPLRRAIYFGTGNATTYPAAATSDAVMALDMDSGKVLWSYQSQSQFIIIHCQSQKQKPSVAIAFLSVWATTSSHEISSQ